VAARHRTVPWLSSPAGAGAGRVRWRLFLAAARGLGYRIGCLAGCLCGAASKSLHAVWRVRCLCRHGASSARQKRPQRNGQLFGAHRNVCCRRTDAAKRVVRRTQTRSQQITAAARHRLAYLAAYANPRACDVSAARWLRSVTSGRSSRAIDIVRRCCGGAAQLCDKPSGAYRRWLSHHSCGLAYFVRLVASP